MRFLRLLLLVVPFAGCGDDMRPADDAWFESTLPAFTNSAVLFGAVFDGSRGIAVGAEAGTAGSKPIFLENLGGSWGQAVPEGLPAMGSLTGAALTRDGAVVVVGFEGPGLPVPVLLDERGGWDRVSLAGSNGTLNSVIHAGGDSIWACGSADGGLFYLSPDALSWDRVPAGLGTPAEKGFNDLSFQAGVTYACGYDDGEAPFSIVLRNGGAGWTVVTHPDPTEMDLELDSILIDDEGTLWVGGHTTRVIQTALITLLVDSARLYRRPSGGGWSELTVPDADLVQSIQDIVQMSTGTVYFAAGGDVRLFLWANSEVREVILPELDGGLSGLAEGQGGILYAVGSKLDPASGKFKPLILRGRVGL